MNLNQKRCLPCEGGVEKLASEEIQKNLLELNKAWQWIDQNKIRREFRFVNFTQTMDFVNKVAQLAEIEGHHPEMFVGYGKCDIWLWTHAIGGLSINDFILAAKIDEL